MPKSWQGQPVLPYSQHYVSAGNSLRLEITSLDFDSAKETPSGIEYRIDNLTNNVAVLGWTAATPAQPTVIDIPASLNVMYGGSTFPGNDSQQMQVTIKATFADGSQAQTLASYSLNAIYQGQG